MYQGKCVTAVITAAGSGSRMGAAIPKQFLKIADKTILQHAISPFEELELIDDILVVTSRDFAALCNELCSGFKKVKEIVVGGKERQDSVKNALDLIDDGYVLVHDGARPFVTVEIIKNVLKDAHRVGAAVAAVPVKDTIREQSHEGGRTLKRSELYSVQTPQGFSVSLYKKAVEENADRLDSFTDDCSVVESLGYPVYTVMGDYKNIKITTAEDLQIAEVFTKELP